MTERKTVITLDEAELQVLEQVLMDRDGEAALRFLETVVRKQVDASARKALRPGFGHEASA